MSQIKRRYLSLIEVLFVIALLGVFFSMAVMFYYDGRKLCREYMNKATQTRSVSTLSKAWREFVHTAREPLKVTPENILFKNNAVASVKDNKIILDANGGKKSFALPKAFTASFALEKPPQEAPLLLLYLRTKGGKGQVLKDKFIRLTANTGETVK